MKYFWHDKHEKHVFIKYVLITVLCFLVVATINFGLVVKSLQPINIVLPFLIGSVVGALLGHNALLRMRLERSNNTKSKFLSSMNHELRTPMNAILGFAELLDDEQNLNTEQKDGVRRIISAGNHTLGLINELLDFASVETGKVHLEIEPLPVTVIMNHCIDMTESLAQKHNIQIRHNDTDFTGIQVDADEMRLKQVFINLLSNAVKYNNEDGAIEINYSTTPRDMVVSVTDTGKGIDRANIPYLFEPFNRLGAEKSSIEGSGVGLSITKSLIEMMKGHITCESETGQGTTFRIQIPLTSAQ